jgi:hypothetical protein
MAREGSGHLPEPLCGNCAATRLEQWRNRYVGRMRRSRLAHRAVHALASFLLNDSRRVRSTEAHRDLIKSCWELFLDYSSDKTSILRI